MYAYIVYKLYTYILVLYVYIYAENIKKSIIPMESLYSTRNKFKKKNMEVQMITLKRISAFRNQDERGLGTNNKEESVMLWKPSSLDSCFKKMKSLVVSNDAFQ